MNQQTFESGYASYRAGDWATAAYAFLYAKHAGEISGRVDHLRGNALMQMGRYSEAADAYGDALADTSYGMVGALSTNRGRALVAAGRLEEAVESLNAATRDASYATPYKAYMALGGAYRALGDTRNAGIAFRNAAIDEANPDPSASLRKLGNYFMELGRPADAVESYRTALDFSTDGNQNAIYCDLALAYVATNRMTEAVDAFDHASADGTFTLSPEAQASYDAARNAIAARSGERRASDTDDFLASVGYGVYDPLDPTGQTSDSLMPSPEDTGFFSITEEEIIQDDRKRRRGIGGRIIIVILVLLVLLVAAGGFAYYSGFGWPMQEAVVTSMFQARTDGEDLDRFISSTLDDNQRRQIEALVPQGATVSISGVTRSMRDSEVNVTATLAEGGERSYVVTLVRDGIGWKVSEFTPAFVSADGDITLLDTTSQSNSSQSEQAPAASESAEAPAASESAEAPAEETPAEEAAPAEGEGGGEGQPSSQSEATIEEVPAE